MTDLQRPVTRDAAALRWFLGAQVLLLWMIASTHALPHEDSLLRVGPLEFLGALAVFGGTPAALVFAWPFLSEASTRANVCGGLVMTTLLGLLGLELGELQCQSSGFGGCGALVLGAINLLPLLACPVLLISRGSRRAASWYCVGAVVSVGAFLLRSRCG